MGLEFQSQKKGIFMIGLKQDEKILVIPRSIFFAQGMFQGFLPTKDFEHYQNMVMQYQLFLWRSSVENDPSHKQIIPYLIFEYNNMFFVMQRKSTASETRLKNKYSLGIGGHIRQEDLVESSLISWAQREFNEEVSYTGTSTVQPIGLINDDSDAVGQVHVGFVFIIHGDSPDIAIKSEHKDGKLLTLDEIQALYPDLEQWSQLVFDYLTTCSTTSKINSLATMSIE
jgi:predicted NUDIX family phosphoesterase